MNKQAYLENVYNSSFNDELSKLAIFKGNLNPHQQEALNKIFNTDAMLLYHSLGSGKTATSIAATEGMDTDVVVPASLRENYKKELKKFVNGESDKNIMSYQKFTKEGPSYSAKALVIDEAQRIGRNESQMSQNIIDAAKFYDKRLLLTGTPASNSPRELATIIRILSPDATKIPLDPVAFNNKFIGERKLPLSFWNRLRGIDPGIEQYPKNIEILKDAIKGKVHYYKSSEEDYPERRDEIKEIEASKRQAQVYNYVTSQADPIIAMKVRMNLPLSKKELKSINAFMGAARQVSNTPSAYSNREEPISNKLRQVVEDVKNRIQANERHKSLIYSNYLGSGINDIGSELEKENIPYSFFTGKMNDRQKSQAVEDYNNDKIKALLVSSSGSEGIDLKGTRVIHILEPHWNKNRVEQVIGRGIRYKSHSHLPEDERTVDVIKYQTTLPKTMMQKIFNKNPDTSADKYLENLSEKKQELLDKYLNILKEEGMRPVMEKKSYLENVYNSAFNDELEKIAEDSLVSLLSQFVTVEYSL